ncbi:MAG: exonuclease subunit SbcD [Bacteroidia bacterium]
MKILHTSDWHLGKYLGSFSRLPEQQEVMAEICEIADEHEPDAVLVAGDLFDTFNPSAAAVDLFYQTLKRLTNNGRRPVVAIAGNHDSPERIENPDPLARECGIHLLGFPHSHPQPCRLDCGLEITRSAPGFIELSIPGCADPLRIIATPYASEFRLKRFLGNEDPELQMREILQEHWLDLAQQFCDNKGVNVLMAHLYMTRRGAEAPPEPEDEKPILHVGGAQQIFTESIPYQIQYVALGHLHGFFPVDKNPCPAVYCSSPLCYSFSEAGQQKNVVLIDVEPGNAASYSAVPLSSGRPLLRKAFEEVDLALQWLRENPTALVELTLFTDTYLSGKDKRALQQAHDGIVQIIPRMTGIATGAEDHHIIELSKGRTALFSDYFQHKYGQQPGEELLALFSEMLGKDED